ncbi:capsid [uncultured virus]|uniref:Capsid n=1 Tax=uncultured virus TaxID=340016 RepID=A0A2K9LSN6_9VIRU|nr:capsid [uncultured virus]
MAYRRRVRFRRRARRAPWYRRKYNAVQLASKALRGLSYVKGLVNSEMFHNTFSATTYPNHLGDIIPLTNIAIGDTAVTRTGNSLFVRSIAMNMNCSQNASALDNTFIRMILFIDTQQVSDTTPTISNILATTGPNALVNLDSAGRYKFLKTWEFALSTQNPAKVIKYYKNIRHHVRYNGPNATDIQKGGLYLAFVSSQATNTPALNYHVRIGYHDN